MSGCVNDSDLPQVQSIQLGAEALEGDGRDDRDMTSEYPYNYSNTLTMRGEDDCDTE